VNARDNNDMLGEGNYRSLRSYPRSIWHRIEAPTLGIKEEFGETMSTQHEGIHQEYLAIHIKIATSRGPHDRSSGDLLEPTTG